MVITSLMPVGFHAQGVGPDETESLSLLSCCGSLFISYLWKIFSVSLHIILIDRFSVSSGNFGVPIGGAELFLLCHLDPNLFLLLL